MYHAGNIYLDLEEEVVFKTDAAGDRVYDDLIDSGDPNYVRIRIFCNNQCEVSAEVEGLGETMGFDFK